jgi:pimeloyl-ACP methyl ester carboxylesterase
LTTAHRWFASGRYTLLGHVDSPDQTSHTPRLGLLIVPPFGWEDACSYRPLRVFGQALAEDGIPVLRYDLPATGDSSGTPREEALLAAWIQSVADAAEELRRSSGVERVAVLGIRLGAILALSAAARGARIDDLILWGASSTGRAVRFATWRFRNSRRPIIHPPSPPQAWRQPAS